MTPENINELFLELLSKIDPTQMGTYNYSRLIGEAGSVDLALV